MASTNLPLARIAVRSTVWVTLGTYFNQIVAFAATLLITRILSPDIFGFFSLGIFWSTLLNLRPKSGLTYAAIQRPQTDGDLLGTYYVLDLAAALGSLALSFAAAFVLAQLGYAREVSIAVVALMGAESLSAIASPLAMVLEKELQLSRLALVALIAAIVAYAVALAMALSGAGLWSLLAINLIVAVLSLGGVYWVCRRRWPQAFTLRWRFDRKLAGELLRSGLPTGLSLTALSSIVTQFDNFLIGTFVSYATLGLYDRAYRIAHWPNLLLTTIVSRVGFLTFAKVQDDPPRLTHAVRLSLWVLSTLGAPIALVLFFGAPDVVGVLYSERWSGSVYFLRFLTIYSLVWPFVSVGLWLSIAKGHRRTTLLFTGAQAAALIVFATPLTLQFGVDGTIAGVMLTMLLAFGLSCRYIFRQVSLSFREAFGPPAIALLIAVAILFGLLQIPGWNGWLPLARLVVIGLAGPGAFMLTLFALRRSEMIERVRYFKRAFRPSG